MPAGQTRHKKNFDQHHSQQQCGGSAQHPQRAGHTTERCGRKLEPPDEPPQKHQRHSARQQRAAQSLALQAEAAERPHGVVQQPRAGKDRQQQVRPRGPDRAAPGEYLRVQDGIPGRIARRHAGGQQCRTGQRHADAQRLVGILQSGRLRRRPPRGQVGQRKRRQPRDVPQPDRPGSGKAGVGLGPEQQVGQMQPRHDQAQDQHHSGVGMFIFHGVPLS